MTPKQSVPHGDPSDSDSTSTLAAPEMVDLEESNILSPSTSSVSLTKPNEKKIAYDAFIKLIIRILYGFTDGLNTAQTSEKFAAGIISANATMSTTDRLHQWTTSPIGAGIAAFESTLFIIWSTIANGLDADKDFRSPVTTSWLYWREIVKSSKNAMSGMKTGISTLNKWLAKTAYRVPLLTLALPITVIATVKNVWLRNMVTERKQQKNINKALRQHILGEALSDEFKQLLIDHLRKNENHPDAEKQAEIKSDDDYINYMLQTNEHKNQIAKQTKLSKWTSFALISFGSIIDSLYFHMGMPCLLPIAPVAFLIMSVISLIYIPCTIAANVFQEYDYQRDLELTELSVSCALAERDLVNCLKNGADQTVVDNALTAFETERKKLIDAQTHSRLYAFLSGIKDALSTYSIITCSVFVLTVFTPLFPAFLAVSTFAATVITGVGIALGLLALAVHGIVSVVLNEIDRKEIETTSAERERELQQKVSSIRDTALATDQKEEKIKELKATIEEGKKVKPSRLKNFGSIAEIIRSAISSSAKGVRITDYVFGFLANVDSQGHASQSRIMVGISMVFAVSYSIINAARSYMCSFWADAKPVVQPSSNYTSTTSSLGKSQSVSSQISIASRLTPNSTQTSASYHSQSNNRGQKSPPMTVANGKKTATSSLTQESFFSNTVRRRSAMSLPITVTREKQAPLDEQLTADSIQTPVPYLSLTNVEGTTSSSPISVPKGQSPVLSSLFTSVASTPISDASGQNSLPKSPLNQRSSLQGSNLSTKFESHNDNSPSMFSCTRERSVTIKNSFSLNEPAARSTAPQ